MTRLASAVCLDRTVQAAGLLQDARRLHHAVPPKSEFEPADIAEAYAVQDLVVAALLADHGGRPIGWKIGCTNESAQRLLNVDRPFFGRLLSAFAHASPARLSAADFNLRIVEAEFAYRLGADLDARDAPFAAATVEAALAAIVPAIEIVDCRLVDWLKQGVTWRIADNALTGHWVSGGEVVDRRRFNVANHQVELFVNGQVLRRGSGAKVLGGPLNALVFLANALSERGLSLRRGDLVTTGTAIDVYSASAGDAITADFGDLGRVELAFAE